MENSNLKLDRLSAFCQIIAEKYPVRKTKKQKAEFRAELIKALEENGWQAKSEAEGKSAISNNVLAGDLDKAKLVLSAHYDTPAALPIPNFLTPQNLFFIVLYQLLIVVAILIPVSFIHYLFARYTNMPFIGAYFITLGLLFALIVLMMAGPANKNNANDNTSGVVTLLETAGRLPEEMKSQVALVFFDNEELGLLGSAAFAKKHGKLEDKLLINFDCVGDGENLLFVLSKELRKSNELSPVLAEAFTAENNINPIIDTSPFTFYPSDQKMFKRSVGVGAFHRHPVAGLYISRIHTKKDTVLKQENIEFLYKGIESLIPKL